MRVLRITTFMPNPGGESEPASAILRDKDINTTIEDLRERSLDMCKQGMFFVFDIFDMPDGELENAVIEAMNRLDQQRDLNQAILWWYSLETFKVLSPSGVCVNPKPAPLTGDEIAAALAQVALHPAYKAQTVVTHSGLDGEVVKLEKGAIERDVNIG